MAYLILVNEVIHNLAGTVLNRGALEVNLGLQQSVKNAATGFQSHDDSVNFGHRTV
jgi:hypothetical protein